MAADVERFLANERVSCYREKWSERLNRFERRHRTTLRVAMLGLAGPNAKLEGDGPYRKYSSGIQAVVPAATPAEGQE